MKLPKSVVYQIVIILIYCASLHCLATSIVQAANGNDSSVVSRENWRADEGLVDFEESYGLPEKVTIVILQKQNTSTNSLVDIRDIYYYFATRSGFGDLPFHYLLTKDGQVYSGNKSGEEAKIDLGENKQTLFIAYIPDKDNEFSILAVDQLKNIVLQIINKYAIAPKEIKITELTYTYDEKAKLTKVDLIKASDMWQEQISPIIKSISKEFTPAKTLFELEIIDVVLPPDPLEPTKTAEIKLKLKNTGDLDIHSSSNSNILVTNLSGNKSIFHLPDQWDSLSQTVLLKKGEHLLQGEEKEFSFEVFVPLYPPEISEDFVLVDPKSNKIKGSSFEISLNIKDTDQTIIEIQNTRVGYLNVRSNPGTGEVITKVIPGERFIAKDYKYGYYQIEANGKVGWVVNMYTKVI